MAGQPEPSQNPVQDLPYSRSIPESGRVNFTWPRPALLATPSKLRRLLSRRLVSGARGQVDITSQGIIGALALTPSMPSSASWPLQRGIVHTFAAASDEDKNPYVFDVCSNRAGQLAVSACGPGHAIKVGTARLVLHIAAPRFPGAL